MLADKSSCTGCGACAASCPLNCINMSEDREGFRFPIVDRSLCVSCRKCEKVCPLLNEYPKYPESQAYGARHKNDLTRINSSSGGVFPALASFVLENGGAVCGAAYTACFDVEHRIIENASEIGKLQGAKYAQSRTEHLFDQLRSILEDNRWLLFVGTPCQTAGLKAYLVEGYERLILVDMICHGVPSPMVWQKYLDFRKKNDTNHAQIISINQRDKSSGWSKYRYSIRIDYSNGQSYCVPQSQDWFMLGFVNNLFLRPSCAQCQFKGEHRCSDITLGDYWGVWEQLPELDDDKGTSIILLNTPKGLSIWDRVKDQTNSTAVGLQTALSHNPSAHHSSAPHKKRDVFFEKIGNVAFDKLMYNSLFGTTERKFSLHNILRKIKHLL